MAASHSRTTRFDGRRQIRCCRTRPLDKPPRIGHRVGGDAQPCGEAPVPGTLLDVTGGGDRFQYGPCVGVPLLPQESSRECQRRKQHNLWIAKRRCRGIGRAAGVLGIVQLCEVGLCEAEIHRGLERLFDGAGALKPIVRARKQRTRIRSSSAGQQEPAEPERGVTGAPELAAPFECGERRSQGSLGCRMTAAGQQPFDLDHHLGRARISGRRASAVRRSSFCCLHDVSFL